MGSQRPLQDVWGKTSVLNPTLLPRPLSSGHTYLCLRPRDEHWGCHLQTEPAKVPLTKDVLHRHPAEGRGLRVQTWAKRTRLGLGIDHTCSQKCKVGSGLLGPGTLAKAFPSYLLPVYYSDPPFITLIPNISLALGHSSSLMVNWVGLGERKLCPSQSPQGQPMGAHLCSRWLLSSWTHCSCQGVRGFDRSPGLRL